MNEDSKGKNEIIRLFLVDEDGNEVEVDQNDSSFLKLEITNTEDVSFALNESDTVNDASTDKLSEEDELLQNMKVEVIKDPDEEFAEYYANEEENEDFESDNDSSTTNDGKIAKTLSEVRRGRPPLQKKRVPAHTCAICGYSSHQKSHYRRHMNIHFKSEQLECGICRKPMNDKAQLNEHMDEHRCQNDRSKYKCHLCPYTSNKLTNVSHHTEVHFKPRKEKLECDRCNFATTNKIRFRNHIAMHLNSNRTTRCPVCLLVFKSMALRRKHIQRYKCPDDPNRYKCPECLYTTIKFNNFKQHMVIHRSEFEVEMFQCSDCPFKSKRKTDLKQHIIVKHRSNDEVQLFQCDFCSYMSRRGNHLTSHMKNRHRKLIIWKRCSFCSYKTVSSVLIKKHFSIHTKLPENYVLCYVCGYSCQSQSAWDRHVMSHSTKEDKSDESEDSDTELPLGKEDSEQPISYSYELVKVKQEQDPDAEEKEIAVCCCQVSQCNFMTKDEREAKIHHTICHNKRGEDNRCPECTFHTTSRYLYLDHLKVHRIDVEHLKPHLCDICGTRWIRKGDLTRHMSVHWNNTEDGKKENNEDYSDKKTLNCNFCDYKTRIRLCLFKHMLKHGKEHQDNFNSYYDNDDMEAYFC